VDVHTTSSRATIVNINYHGVAVGSGLLFVFHYFVFLPVPAPLEIYTLSLHDALPILGITMCEGASWSSCTMNSPRSVSMVSRPAASRAGSRRVSSVTMDLLPALEAARSEEHTSELQSLRHLVCRLLLEKKKNK